MNQINQLRICVEKDDDLVELEKLRNNKILRAAFLQKKIWDPNTELYIYFMNNNPDIEKTPLSWLKQLDDDNNIIYPLLLSILLVISKKLKLEDNIYKEYHHVYKNIYNTIEKKVNKQLTECTKE